MTITRQQFADENRRMKRLRCDGWTQDQIKRWLSGWRQVPKQEK